MKWDPRHHYKYNFKPGKCTCFNGGWIWCLNSKYLFTAGSWLQLKAGAWTAPYDEESWLCRWEIGSCQILFGDFVYKGMGEVPNKFITPYLPSNLSLHERGKGGVPLLWMKSTKWYLMPSLYDPLDLWIKQLILKPQINTHSTSNSWYRDTAAECRLSPQEQFNLYSTDKRSGLKSWHKGSVKVIRVTCDMGISHATHVTVLRDRNAWKVGCSATCGNGCHLPQVFLVRSTISSSWQILIASWTGNWKIGVIDFNGLLFTSAAAENSNVTLLVWKIPCESEKRTYQIVRKIWSSESNRDNFGHHWSLLLTRGKKLV